jgi:hypothetical protein
VRLEYPGRGVIDPCSFEPAVGNRQRRHGFHPSTQSPHDSQHPRPGHACVQTRRRAVARRMRAPMAGRLARHDDQSDAFTPIRLTGAPPAPLRDDCTRNAEPAVRAAPGPRTRSHAVTRAGRRQRASSRRYGRQPGCLGAQRGSRRSS